MSDYLREVAYRIWGTCHGLSGETADDGFEGVPDDDGAQDDGGTGSSAHGDSEPPIKLPDPPDDEGGFTEPEMPKIGSRDAPGG